MSKIYNKYLELKKEEPDKLYLFHSGKFYIFIADDVETINQYVVLKKTKFTNEVNKCGFPDNSYDDYMRVFHNHHLNIEIIEASSIVVNNSSNNFDSVIEKYFKIEKYVKDVDINAVTPLQSMEILYFILRCIHD